MTYYSGIDDSDDRWSLASLMGLTAAGLRRIALAYVIAACGSLTFLWLHLPLPIFLGSLTFCIIAAFNGVPFERPRPILVPVRGVLGVAVGAAFTPAVFGSAGGMLISLALIVPYSVLLTLVGMLYFERMAGYSRPTAFFAAVPGGLSDMVTMSADVGADQRAVTLVHATRIAFIVFTVPFFVRLSEGVSVGGQLPNFVHLWEVRLIDLAALLVLGVCGYQLARWLGMAGAALVGPMIVSALFHALGITAARVPFEIMTFAQLTLGISLGIQFRDLSWKDLRTTMVWAVSFSAILVIIAALVAIPVAALTRSSQLAVLLAYAPGGQAELNLLGMMMHVDVAFVALHHLVRLAIVIIGAQMVFALRKDWRQPKMA